MIKIFTINKIILRADVIQQKWSLKTDQILPQKGSTEWFPEVIFVPGVMIVKG